MKGIIYFSHDANAMNDTKILNMRADYGMEGYGLFWAIVEQLRVDENYQLALSKNTYRAIKIMTNTTIDIEKYINDCINEYGLFKITEDGKFFYSLSLKRRMDLKDEKKNKRAEAGKKGAEKRWKNDNAKKNDSNAIKNDSNAKEFDSKKWQSKVKKSKVKESKVNNITKLNQTMSLILNNKNNGQIQEFHRMLQHIDLDVENAEDFEYMTEDTVKRYEIVLVCLYELFISPYRVYLNKLSKEKLMNKYYKTEQYIGTLEIYTDQKVGEFMSYFLKSLMNDFDTKT